MESFLGSSERWPQCRARTSGCDSELKGRVTWMHTMSSTKVEVLKRAIKGNKVRGEWANLA